MHVVTATLFFLVAVSSSASDGISSGVLDTIGSIVGGTADTIGSVVNGTADTIGTVVNGTVDTVGTVVNGTVDTVGTVVNGTVDTIGTVVNGTEDTVGAIVNGTEDTVGTIVNGTEDTVGTIVNVTSSTVSGILDDLTEGNVPSILSIIDNLEEELLNTLLELLLQEIDLPLGTALPEPELIEAYGYPVETHEVITEDGYILTLHRIPYGKDESSSSESKSVALFVPGLGGSGALFLVNSYENNLPYVLADDGYDVWLLNPRGTSYSSTHVNSTITEAQYFNYSFTQKGLYDTASSIDYILNNTQQDNLLFIGHSEGATDFLVLVSERPEYNEKIKQASLLAPLAYMKNTPNTFLQYFAGATSVIEETLQGLGIYSFGTPTVYLDVLAIIFCNDLSPLQNLCYDIIGIIGGYDPQECNNTLLPLLFTHYPEAVSLYELLHYEQLIASGEFSNYDYGSEGNLVQYGTTSPPNFNISNIVTPVILYYGLGDSLVSPIDVQELANQLPNLVGNYTISDELFSNFDFVFAKDVDVLLNNDLIENLE